MKAPQKKGWSYRPFLYFLTSSLASELKALADRLPEAMAEVEAMVEAEADTVNALLDDMAFDWEALTDELEADAKAVEDIDWNCLVDQEELEASMIQIATEVERIEAMEALMENLDLFAHTLYVDEYVDCYRWAYLEHERLTGGDQRQ